MNRLFAPLRLMLFLLLVAPATGAAAPAADAAAPERGTPIASEGFGRPERLDVLAAGSDVRVAIAGSEAGPIVVWEDQEGLLWQLPGEDEPVRLVASRGVRDLEAGAAGDDPVVAWSERDLADGRTYYLWRWRGETRTLFDTRQAAQMSLVAGSDRPELLVATPTADGWRAALHDWDGGVREMEPRPLTLAGLDALRHGETVHLVWLEGIERTALGTVERDWTAYRARWPDGDPRPEAVEALGEALRLGDAGSVRLAQVGGDVHALWRGPEDRLHATGPGGPRRDLGTGVPLGWTGGAWTWLRGADLRRSQAGEDEVASVLHLPAAPERIVAAEHGGVTAAAWSSGRYLGGIEVWAVTDRTPYRARPIERLATAMGWDPWRPWSAAGGHLLLALLTAVLGAAFLTPVWWLGAALLARRDRVGAGVATLEGAAVAVASLLAILMIIAARATTDAVPVRALTGGPGWIAAASISGFLLAWIVRRGHDAEAAFARLVAAWIAGSTMLFVLAFGTLQAWLTLFGATA